MVVLTNLYIIPANTPAFQEYARHAILTNAQDLAVKWRLDPKGVAVNIINGNMTNMDAEPTTQGISHGANFGDRYAFDYDQGHLALFNDIPYSSMALGAHGPAEDDVKRWVRATNLLTLAKARKIAEDAIRGAGIPLNRFKAVTKWSHQKTYHYEEDGVERPLPLYSFEWASGPHQFPYIGVEVSGITGRIARFFYNGNEIRLKPPTNYFEMLGLPNNAVLVRRLRPGPPPVYEVVDEKNDPYSDAAYAKPD